MKLSDRIARARVVSPRAETERARAGLQAFVASMQERGEPDAAITAALASGAVARTIGQMGTEALAPRDLACAEGCAFCCILLGADGGTLSEAEARDLHAALAPRAGHPDGSRWHPQACAALDPETRRCRAYDARPMICRTYVSTDAAACEQVAQGVPAQGPGTLGPYHTYLAALGLSRAALKGLRRVATFSLARLTRAAVDGLSVDDALAAARHKPANLDAELRRSKRDLARAGPPGLP